MLVHLRKLRDLFRDERLDELMYERWDEEAIEEQAGEVLARALPHLPPDLPTRYPETFFGEFCRIAKILDDEIRALEEQGRDAIEASLREGLLSRVKWVAGHPTPRMIPGVIEFVFYSDAIRLGQLAATEVLAADEYGEFFHRDEWDAIYNRLDYTNPTFAILLVDGEVMAGYGELPSSLDADPYLAELRRVTALAADKQK